VEACTVTLIGTPAGIFLSAILGLGWRQERKAKQELLADRQASS
jgi:hypothetical protein